MSASQTSNVTLKQQVFANHYKTTKHAVHIPKSAIFAAYVGIFTILITTVSLGYTPSTAKANAATVVSATTAPATVDQVVALQVASGIAKTADLPVAANVANLSISTGVKANLDQGNDAYISKPQIIQPTAGSRAIVAYVTKPGDTVQSVANQYHVTAQTIKWANNLTADTLDAGKTISVPPIDGVIYTVKDSDSLATIADKYKTDGQAIVTFNDLELSGIKSGQRIILPGATLPSDEQPGYTPPHAAVGSGLYAGFTPTSSVQVSTSAGNAYAFGNCTWWAYERRMQLGHPVGSFWGNAATWNVFAQAAGFIVNKTPSAGAVFQMPAFVDSYTGSYGHVGIVEAVNGDGSIYVSEMNYAGNFNHVTNRTIPAAQAALYNYIH